MAAEQKEARSGFFKTVETIDANVVELKEAIAPLVGLPAIVTKLQEEVITLKVKVSAYGVITTLTTAAITAIVVERFTNG